MDDIDNIIDARNSAEIFAHSLPPSHKEQWKDRKIATLRDEVAHTSTSRTRMIKDEAIPLSFSSACFFSKPACASYLPSLNGCIIEISIYVGIRGIDVTPPTIGFVSLRSPIEHSKGRIVIGEFVGSIYDAPSKSAWDVKENELSFIWSQCSQKSTLLLTLRKGDHHENADHQNELTHSLQKVEAVLRWREASKRIRTTAIKVMARACIGILGMNRIAIRISFEKEKKRAEYDSLPFSSLSWLTFMSPKKERRGSE